MRLTKADMARVIVCALYNLPALPLADNPRVVALVRHKADFLAVQHKRAIAIIEERNVGADDERPAA